MPVIIPSSFGSRLSPFMFSATLVGPLAEAGVEGVAPSSAGAEIVPAVAEGPIVLQA